MGSKNLNVKYPVSNDEISDEGCEDRGAEQSELRGDPIVGQASKYIPRSEYEQKGDDAEGQKKYFFLDIRALLL